MAPRISIPAGEGSVEGGFAGSGLAQRRAEPAVAHLRGAGTARLRVLCVGTGRDGTQSVSHMMRHLLDRSGGQVMHEYCCREFYQAFCEHRETSDPVYAAELRRMVGDCPHEGIVGNGYAAILPLFAEHYGRGLKLVHLRRADRAAGIASLVQHCALFPAAYGYYSASPEATVKRMAAFHFGEMSRAAWDHLPIEEKFAWYYDKTHALIDRHKALFDSTLDVETEMLDNEATRRALAQVVTGNDAVLPPKTHLNAASIDISSFPDEHRHKMHWLMGRLNLEEVARDDVYALDYFLEKYIAWTGYQLTNAPQLGPSKPAPEEKVRADLDRAIAVVKARLREMESLRGPTQECRQAEQVAERPAAPPVEVVRAEAEAGMNNLQQYADVFASIKPWSGIVPAGFEVDFLGIVTPKEFLEAWGLNPHFVDGAQRSLGLPTLGRGEPGEDFWFETANWIMAARDAREKFVMMTLGALYGYQAIGSCRMLQLVNPMPYKLVAVEPIPENVRRMRRVMRDNGIDPDDQWLIEAVVSNTNDPAFFPIGAPGMGSQNCVSTNHLSVRELYLKQFIAEGRAEEALRNLLLYNSTGLQKDVLAGRSETAEIKLVSCLTLRDLVSPFDRVDYIEADMQESEIRAFPPFVDLLRRKVKRIHIATHGLRVHTELHNVFAARGWRIVFSYAPDSTHSSPWGEFKTNDGVLTVVNPDL